MAYATTIEGTRFTFPDLRSLLAKATPERSGDQLAGLCAEGPVERLAAQIALADLPLKTFSTPEDIANMALFLVSDQARTITGQAINVDAGFTI